MELMDNVRRGDMITFPRGRRIVTVRDTVPVETIEMLNEHNMISDLFLRLLPVWVAEVMIDISDSEAVFETTVLYEYRQVRLDIGREFYHRSSQERATAMIHEAVHAHTAVLESFTETLIDSLGLEEDPVYQKTYDMAREAVVQDLAVLIGALMSPGVSHG